MIFNHKAYQLSPANKVQLAMILFARLSDASDGTTYLRGCYEKILRCHYGADRADRAV